MIYELRIYRVMNGRMTDLLTRFEHHGRATLKGEGAKILFGWLFPCVCYTLGIGGPLYAPIPF